MRENGFEYWYEFLKRSEEYKKCCAAGGKGPLSKLYADFGDVHAETWKKWWHGHHQIFATFDRQPGLREITSITDFRKHFVPKASNQIAVILNLDVPKGFILMDLDALLLNRMAANKIVEMTDALTKRGKALSPKEKEKWDLLMMAKETPNTETKQRLLTGSPKKVKTPDGRYVWASHFRDEENQSLEKVLAVYDACVVEDRKPKTQRMTRYEIGRILGIEPVRDVNRRAKDITYDRNFYNRELGNMVSRYFKWAKEIIANVELGIFPKHNR